jgi:hypothetical protein
MEMEMPMSDMQMSFEDGIECTFLFKQYLFYID